MADRLLLRVDDSKVRGWVAGVDKKLANSREIMQGLAAWGSRHVIQTFEQDGAISGFPRWRVLSRDTVYTRAGTRNIRYGTDMEAEWPKGKGVPRKGHKTGPIRKVSENRRYHSVMDHPLQASGTFRRSFTILSTTKNIARFGSRWGIERSSDIAQDRGVVRVSEADEAELASKVLRWIDATV